MIWMKASSSRQHQWLRSGTLLALFTLVTAAMTLWFQANFEKKAVFVPVTDPTRQERHAFSATAAYLRESGHQVTFRRDMRLFSALPEPDKMLILHSPPRNTRAELWQALYQWVANGGHLVMAPSSVPSARETAFFGRLGAQVVQEEDEAACAKDDAGKACSDPGGQNILGIELGESLVFHTELEGYPVRLAIDGAPPRLGLQPPHLAALRLQGFVERSRSQNEGNLQQAAILPLPNRFLPVQADLLQRYRIGAGSLTLVSSMRPLTTSLSEADNAFLLSAITRDHREIWLWLPGATDSLFKRILQDYPLFLASMVLLLIALFFSHQARLGPPVLPVAQTRRDVLAYFDSAGRFAWRMNRAAGLIQENREVLAHELKRRRRGQRASGTQIQQTQQYSANQIKTSPDEQIALQGKLKSSQNLVRVSQAMQWLQQSLRHSK